MDFDCGRGLWYLKPLGWGEASVGVAGVVVLDSLWVEMSCMLDDGWMKLVDDEGALPNDVVFVKACGG